MSEDRMVPIHELMQRTDLPSTFLVNGEEPGKSRGHISLRATVVCYCGDWDDAEEPTMKGGAQIARRKGWILTHEKGWLCPRCQKEAGKR